MGELSRQSRGILDRGHRIHFEYQEDGIKQIILDPDEWYGYLITFIERSAS